MQEMKRFAKGGGIRNEREKERMNDEEREREREESRKTKKRGGEEREGREGKVWQRRIWKGRRGGWVGSGRNEGPLYCNIILFAFCLSFDFLSLKFTFFQYCACNFSFLCLFTLLTSLLIFLAQQSIEGCGCLLVSLPVLPFHLYVT